MVALKAACVAPNAGRFDSSSPPQSHAFGLDNPGTDGLLLPREGTHSSRHCETIGNCKLSKATEVHPHAMPTSRPRRYQARVTLTHDALERHQVASGRPIRSSFRTRPLLTCALRVSNALRTFDAGCERRSPSLASRGNSRPSEVRSAS